MSLYFYSMLSRSVLSFSKSQSSFCMLVVKVGIRFGSSVKSSCLFIIAVMFRVKLCS